MALSSSSPVLMRAAVVVEPGQVEIRAVPLPQPAPGELRVQVEGCGICASNLPPWEGRHWFTYPLPPGELGHEAWGRVEGIGDGVDAAWMGKRVALLSYRAYAEYDVAPLASTVELPPELDAQPFPAEPLGCALNIFARCGIQAGNTVAIIGIGFLGALLTELAVQAGARVIALGRRPETLEVAKARGAELGILLDDHYRILEQVRAVTDGRFCDVVIEAVGHQWPLDLAGELTRERGRLVVAGYHQDGPRQINMQLWNWRGLDVINAHERDPAVYQAGMRAAVAAVASGRLHPASLYTHRLPLEDLAEGLALTRDRPAGFMKAIVEL